MLQLTGLDGSNPLAFLAALGVLSSDAGWRLGWVQGATWYPVLDGPTSEDDLIDRLWEQAEAWRDAPALGLTYDGKRDLKPRPEDFRHFWQSLPDGPMGRGLAASFGVPEVTDNNGAVKPNALHFTAGQQQFLKMAQELGAGLRREDLHEALIGPWRGDSTLPTLSWDARERRDYALRASDPSKDKRTGTPGADWLALLGWQLLPVFHVRGRLATTGCRGGWKDGDFRWPIWTSPASAAVVGGLLAAPIPRRASARRARGIGAVFQSSILRSDQGGYGSFTPAAPG